MDGRRVFIAIAIALVVAGISGACAGSDDSPNGGSAEPAAGGADDGGSTGTRGLYSFANDGPEGMVSEKHAALAPASIGAPSDNSGAFNATTSAVAVPGIGPSVIKTADLSVQVPDGDFKDSIKAAVSVAQRYGGFVVTTDVADRDRGRGSVEVRIPAESFESALADLHDLGDLQSENVSGVDVSQEFVDLEARLRNLESQERVLRRLMNDAVSVSDTLKVQSELQRVQLDIEQIKGRLNYLGDLTDLGTITVRIAEVGAVPTKAGVIERAWQRALDVATGVVTSVIIGAGFVIPMGILLALFLLLVAKLRPHFAGGLGKS